MLILTKADLQANFSMADAIAADKEALRRYSAGQATVPLRSNLAVTKHNGQNLYMPAVVDGEEVAAGLKIVSVYPDNPKQGLPSVPATVLTLDAQTGMPAALLDGTYLTQLRTGAVQGAATDLLARTDAKIGALIGTGGQAAAQLEAMLTVRPLSEVRVFSLDADKTKAFAAKMNQRFACRIVACDSAQAAVNDADIITTVTTATTPTFADEWIKPGAHINGIGSYTPAMCEIPVATIKRADVIVFDTLAGVWEEAGDFLQPFERDEISKADITGELGQLVAGEINGRVNDQQITVFKSVGSAVLDVFVANQIVKKAQAQHLGTTVQL